MLLGFHQVFAPFLDCVHSFGFRTSEDDGIWNGYRRSTQPVAEEQGSDTYYGKSRRYSGTFEPIVCSLGG